MECIVGMDFKNKIMCYGSQICDEHKIFLTHLSFMETEICGVTLINWIYDARTSNKDFKDLFCFNWIYLVTDDFHFSIFHSLIEANHLTTQLSVPEAVRYQ